MATSDQQDAVIRALLAENDRLRAENEDLLETQRQLESTRENFSVLFNHAPIAWVTVNATGSVQNLNLVAVTLLGFGRAQLVGSPLATSIHHDDRHKLRDHLLAARDNHELQRCELRVVPALQADPIPVRLSTCRTDKGDGSFVITFLDLRESHAAEAERQRLAQAEREAREANDAKDTFIAMLSHELRTPLTPVLAASSALAEVPDLPDELRGTLAIIQRNVATEVQLIDDLLDLTRITHGKMRVEKQAVDVHALARDAMESVRPDAERAQLAVSHELLATRCWVSGDPIRLQQVFHNLLRNALKFTPPGGQIEIRSWNRDEQLLLEVSDNGRGIDGEMLGKLFQPFEQSLQENPGSAKGLGLGLPICRGILQQHDATIAASSPGLGRGTRFVIEIGSIDPPTLRPKAPSVAPAPPSNGLRVLLVEDHEDTADIYERFLRRGGFAVQVANSLQSALAVEPGAFDLLLSDIGLVDGSGLELMRTLRKAGEIKGIAVSGYGTEEDVRASKEAGFAIHLTKPVNFTELLEAIAKVNVG